MRSFAHVILFVFCGIAALASGVVFFVAHNPIINFSELVAYRTAKPTVVLDDAGKEWTRFYVERAMPVEFAALPPQLINAFVAAEDWRFFEHDGISFKGIVRSLLKNIYHGKRVQGASTITQQLVKVLFLNAKKTFSRKIKEQFYAFLIERQYSKEEIFECYMNHIYFGCGIYGVAAAAQRFWGRSLAELSVAQCALLAGSVQSPEHYCPLNFPLSALHRRASVLGQMKKLAFISQSEYEAALKEPLQLAQQDTVVGIHYKHAIRQELEQLVGKEQLYGGGLTVQTSFNKAMQRAAERAFSTMRALKKELGADVEGALMVIDNHTGQIKALVSGSDPKDLTDRCFSMRRQLGSVFKPLVYAAALDAGYSFIDTAVDEPITVADGVKNWSPRNHTHTFDGQMTLARALSYSNNIVTIKVLLAIGITPIVKLAKKSGFAAPIPPYPSLALGCVDATLCELAGYFAMLPSHGIYHEPYLIEWIDNARSERIYKARPKTEKVLEPAVADQVVAVLRIGIERYLAHAKKQLPAQACGKTGTTNDARTAWFAGSTPDSTTVVYIGCDDMRPLGKNVYPVRTAFPLWLAFNEELETVNKQFSFDQTLRYVVVDDRSGEVFPSESSPPGNALKILVKAQS